MGSEDILDNSLVSSTLKNHAGNESTLNRNQSSSLPNIERPKISTPIIDLDDDIVKGEEEVKEEPQLEIIHEIVSPRDISKVINRSKLTIDLNVVAEASKFSSRTEKSW